jgi:hypothetical protein
MKRSITGMVVLLSVTVWPALASEPTKLNVPPEGLSALFNGKDLTNWMADEKTKEHWQVEDGVLHYDGKGGSLRTENEYGDFVLYVDWKIQPGGDSGVYLRGVPQVQIWDRPEGSGGLWNNKQHASKPLVAADNPPGEWNTFKIEMRGENVTVHLNDKLVVDNTPLDTLKGREKGPILLQHHGNPLWFRNVFIKER